jgi:uncharacterized membrane protein YkoI
MGPFCRFLPALLILLLALPASGKEPTEGQRVQPQISLSRAIAIIEKESDGRVVHIALETEHDQTVWDVDALTDMGMFDYRLDATSGRLVSVGRSGRSGLYTFITGFALQDLKALRIAPSEAASIAETATAAKAVSLAVHHIDGRVEYEVVTRDPATRHRLRIDATSGHIVARW